MTELEKMKRAHMYITKLADGIDPLTDMELPEDTVLNNVRLSRCFFYVADVLRQVIDNGGEVKARKRGGREPFYITPEELRGVVVSQEPLAITQLCKLISAASSTEGKLGYTVVTDWLAEKGLLRVEILHNKRRKRVAPQGEQLGIFEESRTGAYGDYIAILYRSEAQQFIIDNLPEMLADTIKVCEET